MKIIYIDKGQGRKQEKDKGSGKKKKSQNRANKPDYKL